MNPNADHSPDPSRPRRHHTPARVWATLYLSAIPLFAVLYTLLRYDFYQSTGHLEPAVLEANRELRGELRQRMRLNFTEHYGAGTHEVAGWRVDGAALEVLDVAEADDGGRPLYERSPDQEVLRFGFAVPVTRLDRRWATTVLCEGDLLIGELPRRRRFAAAGPVDFALVLRSATFSPFGHSPRQPDLPAPVVVARTADDTAAAHTALRLALSAIPSPSEEQLRLRGTGALVLKFYDFGWARRGITGGIERQFARMLYLSTVVMTTLGLGDIVPLTTRARLLVGLQAISGVALAGLFLNAVANRRAWEREERRAGR